MTKTQSQKRRARQARANRVATMRRMAPPPGGVMIRATRAPPGPIRRRPRPVQRPRQRGGGLSQCAQDYVKVLEDPFSGAVACLPTSVVVPTYKMFVRARCVVTTGTQGVGYISLAPQALKYYDNISLANDDTQCAVLYTTGAYTGNSTSTPNFGLPNMAGTTGNSSFSVNSSPAGLRARLVASGLRVRNVTNMSNRGGTIAGIEQPSHDQVDGLSYNQFMSYDGLSTGDVNGAWNSLVYHPTDEDESDFFNNLGTNLNPAAFCGRYLAFFIMAPGGTPQTYEAEATAVFECVGSLVHGMTPSMSDPIGLAAVTNANVSPQSRRLHIGDRAYRIAAFIARIGGSILGNALTLPAPLRPHMGVPLITSA